MLLLSILDLENLLMALSSTLSWLFVGRVLSGMAAAGFATATAYIADVTPPEKRAGAFGLVGATWRFGFVVGPALGGMLGATNPLSPFRLVRANPFGSLKLLRSHHERFGLAATSVFYNLGHTVFPSLFVLWAGYVLHWDARAVEYALALVGLLNIIVQGGLVRPFEATIGERRAIVIGTVAGAVGFFLYGITATVRLFWVGVLVYSPAGFFNPSMMGLTSRRVGQSEQGQLQGANSSIMGIVGMVGPSDTRRAPD